MTTFFPGRWIGGVTLIAGPLIMCAGYLLRYLTTVTALTPQQYAWAKTQPFAAFGQLLAYNSQPALTTLSYAVFTLGALLLFPAFIALAQQVGGSLAFWGGTLLVAGLFSRLYYAGAEQTAFQLTEIIGSTRQHIRSLRSTETSPTARGGYRSGPPSASTQAHSSWPSPPGAQASSAPPEP